MKYLKQPDKIEMVGEIIIGYKTKGGSKIKDLPKISNSKDAANYLFEVWDKASLEHTESVVILPLNRNNKILGWAKISSGGIAGCIMDIKVIMQICLNANASSFVISHNHPSGNTQPSQNDNDMTKRIKAAAILLDLVLTDHIILTADHHYSFADEGNL